MGVWRVLKHAVVDFFRDDVLLMSAGLAFYAALSIAPLLMILIAASGLISGALADSLIQQIQQLIGPRAGEGLALILESARQQDIGGEIAGYGVIVMLISATLVFAHLRSSLNRIWKVTTRRSEIVLWLLTRLISLALVVMIGLVLIASIIISAVLQFLFADTAFWTLIDFGASLLINMVLFGVIFILLPSAKVGWRDAVFGSFVTAVLFLLGKWGIAKYLSFAGVGSIYGAAGSLVVLLVWIYYASIVFFFGAEITHSFAREFGSLRKR